MIASVTLTKDGEVRQLTSEEKEYAAQYLNETDENRQSAIEEIKLWLSERDDLCSRADDFFILRFLRACKFNLEKTKMKMLNYHQQRADLPEWFANKDPLLPELQPLFDLGAFLPLRKVDDQGRMVIFVRPTLHDPYKQSLSEILKICMMIFDLSSRDHVAGSIRGVVAIIDIHNVSFGHALQMRPHVIKNLVHTWQGCCPIRIQSINFINVPKYINVVLTIFKQFMNAKLKSRLHIYGCNEENCCKELPVDILPTDYGGTDGTVEELKDYWKKTAEENRDWYIDDERYKMISVEVK